MFSLLLSVYFMDEFIEVKLTRPIFNSAINAHLTCNSLKKIAKKMFFFFFYI